MTKYLYLKEPGWCYAWVNGGKIPIKPASTYLSSSREGTKTPDENLIHNSCVDMASLPRSHGITIGKNVKNLSIINVIRNGKLQPDVLNADYYKDDGLILSFCNIKSDDVCRKLKKKACVEIYSRL